ncbi:putative mannose-1-phosphate guanylyltransferase/mannose-6-phosphate isomerase [Bacteriovorax sp. BAL6_X]|uniref:mannose-1-phosphate guanylyltransferase n=1 Tax=Bacteriovorax sp. BAL6_X TaxID=1201290 RepID=UPI000385F18F|nr:sugar phosphate nucleotidyltransferase [Bacteriovorax sp. BAL6_X]EPZ49799.1 putative mannose-1-phosphate guanylyltransferase/mannose-6-phosphate isomerase [Bacteriovorax sp. BAL6_X]
MNIYTLIMAGGKGTRLWPESTESKPKQYLSLVGNETLLGQTLDRFEKSVDLKNRFIITTRDQSELAISCSKDQILEEHIIYEPAGRNTAPCILLSLAAIEAAGANSDDIIAVMPSDHVILNKSGFKASFEKAVKLSSDTQTITTIGIPPHFPHTGYGYIKTSEAVGDGFKVDEFVEKPNFEKAKEYLSTGRYVWNAGMFMAPLGVFKEEFAAHSAEMFSFYEELKASLDDEAKLEEVYNKIPKDSIDYAIMEKSSRISLVKAEFDWNDLGSWEALEQVVDRVEGNTIIDSNGTFLKDATGNIIYAPDKHVSLINVQDLVVVSNDKAVMIVPKDDSQRVKEIVQHLKDNKRKELL